MNKNLAQLGAEITAKSSRSTEEQQRCISVYERWCEANQLAPLPTNTGAAEQQLLRFLHSNYKARSWTWGTTGHYIAAVRDYFVTAGLSSPETARVQSWRDAVLRTQGGPRKQKPVDTIADTQIKEATAVASDAGEASPLTTRLQAIVTVADALGISPVARGALVQALPRTAFTVRADAVLIESGEKRVTVVRDLNPFGYSKLVAALEAAGGYELPLRYKDWPAGVRTPSVEDARLLREAWHRAFPAVPTPMNNKNLDALLAGATPEQREWWVRCLSVRAAEAVFDRCYLLLGVERGHRHATLARLTPEHFREVSGGYEYDITPREDKGGIQALVAGSKPAKKTHYLGHWGENGEECAAWCAACALREHLSVLRLRGTAVGSPLFEGDIAGVAIHRNTMSKRLRKMFNVEPGQRVSTRSLRITCVRLCREAGMTLPETSNHLGQLKAASAEPYLRFTDQDGAELTLPTEG